MAVVVAGGDAVLAGPQSVELTAGRLTAPRCPFMAINEHNTGGRTHEPDAL